ncbi:histidine kinase [Nonomuraea recticatena]|uniref:histidine kinase n=1 Tax=Nonomuraea recticatena TaxID=46178 RepID=UPI00361B6E34
MISAVVQPFRLALFRGEADPASPRSRRLRPAMPRPLRGLLPFDHLDLVQVADLLLAWALFGTVLSDLTNLTEAAPQPMWLLWLTATGFSLPVALRDRWPLAAWRLALALLPSALWMSHLLDGARSFLMQGAIMCLLVLYSVAVRCDRRITSAVWAISLVAAWFVLGESVVPAGIALSVVVLFGYNVRVRRSATLSRDTAVEERSVLAERARIARELHDVVAHHLSVIAIQAEAVPLEAGATPRAWMRGSRRSAGCHWRRSRSCARCWACCATRTAAPTPRPLPGSTGWTSSWPTPGRRAWPSS